MGEGRREAAGAIPNMARSWCENDRKIVGDKPQHRVFLFTPAIWVHILYTAIYNTLIAQKEP